MFKKEKRMSAIAYFSAAGQQTPYPKYLINMPNSNTYSLGSSDMTRWIMPCNCSYSLLNIYIDASRASLFWIRINGIDHGVKAAPGRSSTAWYDFAHYGDVVEVVLPEYSEIRHIELKIEPKYEGPGEPGSPRQRQACPNPNCNQMKRSSWGRYYTGTSNRLNCNF